MDPTAGWQMVMEDKKERTRAVSCHKMKMETVQVHYHIISSLNEARPSELNLSNGLWPRRGCRYANNDACLKFSEERKWISEDSKNKCYAVRVVPVVS